MKHITEQMVEAGLRKNVIKPVLNEDGLKAYIGEHWFFFGGSEFEETDPKDIPFDTLVCETWTVLNDMEEDPYVYQDEHDYYYYFIVENCMKSAVKVNFTVENDENVYERVEEILSSAGLEYKNLSIEKAWIEN